MIGDIVGGRSGAAWGATIGAGVGATRGARRQSAQRGYYERRDWDRTAWYGTQTVRETRGAPAIRQHCREVPASHRLHRVIAYIVHLVAIRRHVEEKNNENAHPTNRIYDLTCRMLTGRSTSC